MFKQLSLYKLIPKKLMEWFKKPSFDSYSAKRQKLQRLYGLFFRFGMSKLGGIYLAYLPDSHYVFSSNPEYEDLFHRFISHNALNNGGDIPRLLAFTLNIKQILSEKIAGDFAELGVWRGNTAAILAKYALSNDRSVHLFDTFEGFDDKDITNIDKDKPMAFSDTSLDLVKEIVGINDDSCHYIKGYFPDSITTLQKDAKYAVVSLDCDLYEPMKAGLEFFYPRMSHGGVFFLHDYSSCYWNGTKKAIDDFCKNTGEHIILLPDKSGSAFLRKSKS